jgi:hypothetical protein
LQSVTGTLRIKTEPATFAQDRKDGSDSARVSKNIDAWFSCIVSEAIKKYRDKCEVISNRVQLRGRDRHNEPKGSVFRVLYNQFFVLSIQDNEGKSKDGKWGN